MSDADNVTVSRADFDALLRRANFHTDSLRRSQPDYASVSVSKHEYDSLLRTSYQFDRLKSALIQGGVTVETLDLLIAGSGQTEPPTEPDVSTGATDVNDYDQPSTNPIRYDRLSNGHANGHSYQTHDQLRVPSSQRYTNARRVSSPYEDAGAYEEADSLVDDAEQIAPEINGGSLGAPQRTLYFVGLTEGTTYKDLLSVVKGGKLLNVNIRSERSATISFVDGAAEFLAYAKRNDIYLNHKRVDVRWADRQFRLNGHIENKISNGATRNIVIHSALERGFTEARIREDMEHIHQLVIVDIAFRHGAAYVSMNSIHNALFARTCMLSRSTYKGCKIEFGKDECDVPVPVRKVTPRVGAGAPPMKKNVSAANRFDLLNLDGTEDESTEEHSTVDSHAYGDGKGNFGVSLKFLDDAESTA